MSKSKSFLARTSTRIYLESYLVVMSLIFVFPIVFMFLSRKNPQFFGANILFFEFNMFLSFVLMIYTYFTRDENRNYVLFIVYFVLSFIFLVSTMMILGSNLYF